MGESEERGELVMPLPAVLTLTEAMRVNLRAQRVYARTTQVLPWENVAESTRVEFRRRVTQEMWQDGTLLLDPSGDEGDDGDSSWAGLHREADGVIRGA